MVNRDDPITVQQLDPDTQTILTVRDQWRLIFNVERIELLNTSGVMRRTGVVVGEFSSTSSSKTYNWFTTDTYPPQKSPTIFELVTVSPITYVKTALLRRYTSPNTNPLKFSKVIGMSRGAELQTVWGSGSYNLKKIKELTNITASLKASNYSSTVKQYFVEE